MKINNFKQFYNESFIVEQEPVATDADINKAKDVKNASSFKDMFKRAAAKTGKAAWTAVKNQAYNELHPGLQKAATAIGKGIDNVKDVAARIKDINFPKKIYKAAFNKKMDELVSLIKDIEPKTKLTVDYTAQSNGKGYNNVPIFFPAIDGFIKGNNSVNLIEEFVTGYTGDVTVLLSQLIPKANIDILSFAVLLSKNFNNSEFIKGFINILKKYKVDIEAFGANTIKAFSSTLRWDEFNKIYKELSYNDNTKAVIDSLIKNPTNIPPETIAIFNKINKGYVIGKKDTTVDKNAKGKRIIHFEELGFSIDLGIRPIDFSKFGYDPANAELQTLSKAKAKALYYTILCIQEPEWSKVELQEKKITEINGWSTNTLKVKLVYRLDLNKTTSNIQISG